MHIQGVCMYAKYEDICVRASVCQRAALVWPDCKATNSIVGSSSCSFRAGSLSCLGENDKPKRMLWRRWRSAEQVNKDVWLCASQGKRANPSIGMGLMGPRE